LLGKADHVEVPNRLIVEQRLFHYGEKFNGSEDLLLASGGFALQAQLWTVGIRESFQHGFYETDGLGALYSPNVTTTTSLGQDLGVALTLASEHPLAPSARWK